MGILSTAALPWVLFAALAPALFAIGHIRTRKRHAVPALVPATEARSMMPLMEAAAAAYEAAKRERMVIATVAERPGVSAVDWFAHSIAGVVPVYRRSESGAFEKIDGATAVGTAPQSLYIRKLNYRTYLGWARSMQ